MSKRTENIMQRYGLKLAGPSFAGLLIGVGVGLGGAGWLLALAGLAVLVVALSDRLASRQVAIRARLLALSAVVGLVLLAVAAPAGARAAQRPRSCTVPKVAGLSLKAARTRIEHAGCKLGAIRHPSRFLLVVVRQSPAAGRHVKRGSRVSVWLKVKPVAAVPSTPTTTTPTVSTPATPVYTVLTAGATADALGTTTSGQSVAYYIVSAQLGYEQDASGAIAELDGQPVSYTITDQVTGQAIESFQGATSTGDTSGCAIVYSINVPQATTLTLTGEAVQPWAGGPWIPACFAGTVTAPYSDPLVLNASFAGTSTYAAASDSGPF